MTVTRRIFCPGLGALLKSKGENLVHLGQTGCPPLIGIERLRLAGDHTCTRVNRAMIDALLADAAIVNVWLSFRGALAMSGVEFGGSGASSEVFRLAGGTATNGAAIRDALRSTIALLQSGGKHVGVLLQVPELGFRVINAPAGHSASRTVPRACRVPCRALRSWRVSLPIAA